MSTPNRAPQVRPKRSRWVGVRWMTTVLILLLVGWLVYRQFHNKKDEHYALTLTAGSSQGIRHQLAKSLTEHSAERGLAMTIQPTEGSEDALDKVDAGQVSSALVQGGLSLRKRPNVRQVACLQIEPVHLIVKSELFDAVSKDLGQLRGRTINLSKPGSGTFTLALEILALADLRPGADRGTGDYVINTLSYDDLLATTDAQSLPDAIFTVSSLPSPVVKHLVQRFGYRLVSLPFADAIGVQAQLEEVDPDVQVSVSSRTSGHSIVKTHVYDAEIPAMAYSIQPPVPAQSTRTLGTRLLLVANKDVPSAAIERLVATVYESRFASVARPALDVSLLKMPPEAPLHDGTRQYLDRGRPLLAEDALDWLEKVATIGGAAAGLLLFLFGLWVSWLRQLRGDRFDAYMTRAVELRGQVDRHEQSPPDHPVELTTLRVQLDQLKLEAFQQIVGGKLAGESLSEFFISEVDTARRRLDTMISQSQRNGVLSEKPVVAKGTSVSLGHGRLS